MVKPKRENKRYLGMQKWSNLLLLLTVLLFTACEKSRSFPPEPYLEYTSHVIVSQDDDPVNFPFDYADVELYFTDGDGNMGQDKEFIGVACCDTCDFYCNLFVDVYSKIDGSWSEMYEYNARIDDMTPQSQDLTLEGKIQYKVSLSGRFSDTVRIDMKIVDRDMNYSSIASTPEIYVDL